PDKIALIHPYKRKHLLAFIGNQSYALKPNTLSQASEGVIDDIQLLHQGSQSYIKVFTSTPMAHKINRLPDGLEVELANVKPKATSVPYDAALFSNIKSIELIGPQEGNQPGVIGHNSKLRIRFNRLPYSMDSHLSFDGKYLEIAMESDERQTAYNLLKPDGSMTPDVSDFEPVANVKGKGYTVVVDSGHGGKDNGAMRDGIKEKDMTLRVAHKVRKALEAKGVKVFMTRSTDEFLPLSTITSITNRINPDAFVSVHINASVKPSLNGIETYYYHGRSLPLAQLVHKRMIARVPAKNNGVRQARFYVINHTPVPAILCEIGYISNTEERNAMLTEARQNQTAEAISEGVVQFLNTKRSASLPPPVDNTPEPRPASMALARVSGF
ncbi:MAG: N-acetylmuramoyl-L-alanine amidase, partial [Cyanobacteria bacterium HKST-UBA03]|nr:N-acetylmuramoyl-L-alanine amidase [Cyanobacteria bacterium HKST-UBA03]